MVSGMGAPSDEEPPWEVHWWDYVVDCFDRHPELAHQVSAMEEWRRRLESDPMDVPSYLLPGDELGVRVSRPTGTDVVVAWQVIDWSRTRNAPNRRIVYIRRCRGLDEVNGPAAR